MRALGFTLIEVLVALTVIAVTLASGLRALSQLTTHAERLPQTVAAQACLDNALAGVRLAGRRPAPGEQRSNCAQGRFAYTVVLHVIHTPNPFLMRIEGRVLDASGYALAGVISLAGDAQF